MILKGKTPVNHDHNISSRSPNHPVVTTYVINYDVTYIIPIPIIPVYSCLLFGYPHSYTDPERDVKLQVEIIIPMLPSRHWDLIAYVILTHSVYKLNPALNSNCVSLIE